MQAIGVVSAALLVIAILGGPSLGQTATDLGAPKELPPPDYLGNQFVDSAGCIFVRAEIGGALTWAARVGRDRKPICGYPPSFEGEATEAAEVVASDVADTVEVTADVTEPAPEPVFQAPKALKPRAVKTARDPLLMPAGSPGGYVQVGAFAVAANADRAINRLKAEGFPVSSLLLGKDGIPLKMVLAGPFASEAEVQNALHSTRQNGFPEAYIRR